MTEEEFTELRDQIVRDLARNTEQECDRIRAVTFEEAMKNEEAGVPLFGHHPLVPERTRHERVKAFREHAKEEEETPGGVPAPHEHEFWSAISIAVAVFRARFVEMWDWEDLEDAHIDGNVLELLQDYVDAYPTMAKKARKTGTVIPFRK